MKLYMTHMNFNYNILVNIAAPPNILSKIRHHLHIEPLLLPCFS